METLLSPDPGLYIWTIVSFLVLVGLLKAFAWGPLLRAVEERESAMRSEREKAEAARREAEGIQRSLAEQLKGVDAQAQEILSKAAREGEALRERLKKDAEEESKRLLERSREQLVEEKARLVVELRGEVAALSVQAAERLLKKSLDPGVKKEALSEFLGQLDARGGGKGPGGGA
ncbi:MAG: F0F1 ATP synthase subunit B [Elusimicrobia bacterium]|nr:F0F1 ATP synthase subunit B [Elusimicrobiota bacterium]